MKGSDCRRLKKEALWEFFRRRLRRRAGEWRQADERGNKCLRMDDKRAGKLIMRGEGVEIANKVTKEKCKSSQLCMLPHEFSTKMSVVLDDSCSSTRVLCFLHLASALLSLPSLPLFRRESLSPFSFCSTSFYMPSSTSPPLLAVSSPAGRLHAHGHAQHERGTRGRHYPTQ